MATRREEIMARLLATFRIEAEEHLDALGTTMQRLLRRPRPEELAELLETTFREVHTLKGAARSVSLHDVEAVCQTCETVLSRMTRREMAPDPESLELLQEAFDLVGRLLAGSGRQAERAAVVSRLNALTATPAPAPVPVAPGLASPEQPSGTPLAPAAGHTVRVAVEKLDAALLQAEDLLGVKLAAEERVREVRALAESLAASDTGPEALPRIGSRVREIGARLVADYRAIETLTDTLLVELRRMRMMPASAILDGFARMARDLARDGGKEVEWAAEGAELEVDRKVLETIKDPLLHLVRNAVDHGIEAPDVRVAAGKARTGRVAVSLRALEGGRIEVRLTDDGRGIDLDQVRESAVRGRLIPEDTARSLGNDQALELIYRSGLSTSRIITAVSGHGLGLAIARERVERLDGHIRVESQQGVGTTILMVLPAAIATFHGVLVRAASQLFLLPAEAVERVVRVRPADVGRVEGRDVMSWQATPVFVSALDVVLGLGETATTENPDRQRACVIVNSGDDRAAFLVDEVHGLTDVLVKDFVPPLVRVRNVAAAGLLGSGEVALILRPGDLVRAGQAIERRGPPPQAVASKEAAVLVVDDSITTRTMERTLLEAAGYRVLVAVDGVEAWSMLAAEPVVLVVSDVDMPRMDGFALTERIRHDARLAELPVVLVTALESPEDKARGIEVGANAYVVKSSFDQSNLLEIIRRLA